MTEQELRTKALEALSEMIEKGGSDSPIRLGAIELALRVHRTTEERVTGRREPKNLYSLSDLLVIINKMTAYERTELYKLLDQPATVSGQAP